MKWTDSLVRKDIFFKDLKVGEGFEIGETLYIKVSDDSAFDVINNRRNFFNSTMEVLRRDCEIIFH